MIKLILLGIIAFFIYKIFWAKKPLSMNTTNTDIDDNDLIECSNCHTFVPKSECKFTSNGCICKDCR